MRKIVRSCLLAATALGPSGGSALAQQVEAQPGALPEIVVTSQRREESLQDVPLAVSAFTADTLETRVIFNTLGLLNFVPNMFGSNNTGLGSANAYYIRGLGNTETIATFDPPVGTYVDEVYLSRQNGNNFGFFDVERIEVLRGPQGTLFGRNTTGGAVNVILKRPGDEFGGFLEAGYGAYGRVLVRGSVDLPLSEAIQVKLSGYWNDDKGYVRNTTTGERLNDNDMLGLRAAVQLRATERLTWNAAVAWMEANGENLLNFTCDPRNPTNCAGRFVTTGMREGGPAGGRYTQTVTGRKANFGLGNEVGTLLVTSNIEWAGDNHRLSIITGVVDMSQDFALDFQDGRASPTAANPFPAVRGFTNGGFAILNAGRHQQFTQEVKLDGSLFGGVVDYVAGFYLYDESNQTDFADLFTLDIGSPTGLPLLLADRILVNDTKAQAVYLQADVKLTDQLTVTGGVRYTDETKTAQLLDNRATCAVLPKPPTCLGASLVASNGTPIPTRLETRKWTPRFVVNWKPEEDLLFFASATNGFKSGGWNARATANNLFLPFDPEFVWSYEGGVRSQWFGNRLQANLTVFWLDTKDLQTPSAFQNPATGAITFITQNFADYVNRGVELELTARPLDRLNVYANLGYQKDKYKVSDTLAPNRFGVKAIRQQQADCRAQLAAGRIPLGVGADNAPDCAAGIVTATGDIATPVRTPDWSLSFGGTYDFPFERSGVILSPSVNVTWRSSLEQGTANATIFSGSIRAPSGALYPANPFSGDVITGSRTDSHFLVSASLALRTDDDNWLLALECDNCFDTEFGQSSLVNYTYLNLPRTWLVRLKRKF
ncbi:TonB-dependent receptor [Thermaurantiacus tibetensis]|uniref:TonB-dependent receptor n=1 Tax=Thermaurantiacus tibetensis TaxID=2759035 RepID=UPI001A9C5D71|nr:TonB-dependent receptor [Thermaurantiacus tibetensis]